ncbi:MAG: aminotransferase class III-fold pyridoxal phosphate-dependent enzyme [Armatimonadota bacterium]
MAEYDENGLTFDALMDDPGGKITEAMREGQALLRDSDTAQLLKATGSKMADLPDARFPDKRWFQKSYGREVTDRPDDLMVGDGMFYLTEQKKLFLDCTGGHYQMTWGYDHPALQRMVQDSVDRGIVWDNHSNIPAAPVKRLSQRLIELANPGADLDELQQDDSRLNTVLLGCVTGTVACGAAMKMMLKLYERDKSKDGTPVFITLDGNYHGSDIFAQHLRGMWNDYFTNVEVVMVQPNDPEEIEQVFSHYGERVAGFWAEPIMMNREGIVIDPSYFKLVRSLCDHNGALLAFDEIQTGFWCPEVLYTHRIGVEPDFIILGKGMTAGFHPLAAVLYRGELDVLEKYDAISTNGGAALAAYIALGSIELIQQHADDIDDAGEYYHQQIGLVAEQFPEIIQECRGAAHMTAMKFHGREDALGFHKHAIDRGLWLRVHAYHEGHSTILTKFALPMDREIADYTVAAFTEMLEKTPWRE